MNVQQADRNTHTTQLDLRWSNMVFLYPGSRSDSKPNPLILLTQLPTPSYIHNLVTSLSNWAPDSFPFLMIFFWLLIVTLYMRYRACADWLSCQWNPNSSFSVPCVPLTFILFHLNAYVSKDCKLNCQRPSCHMYYLNYFSMSKELLWRLLMCMFMCVQVLFKFLHSHLIATCIFKFSFNPHLWFLDCTCILSSGWYTVMSFYWFLHEQQAAEKDTITIFFCSFF